METRNDGIMGAVLTEAEKEKRALNIEISPGLMRDLLGEEKISIHNFGTKYMNLKHYDYEKTKEIQKSLSKYELEKFPSMGLDMGIFKNNGNEYISVYDVADIRIKAAERAKEGLVETVQDFIKGNRDIENSNSAVDNLKVHFKWSERFGPENLEFSGKEGLEFVNKLIQADNVYSWEREDNRFQNSAEGYKPYYKTRLALEYGGIKYDIQRIDLGDGVYKNFSYFLHERKESFKNISDEIEKLRSIVPDKVIDDFQKNYNRLFDEMDNYKPENQNFRTSEEAFKELEKVLFEKEKIMKQSKENPWKKDKNRNDGKER